jgi:recombination protein RecR
MNTSYGSQLLDSAVDELSKLPGIGRKTALRLALHLLRREEEEAIALGESIVKMRKEIRFCRVCHNISEHEVCPICSDIRRDASVICVVESVRDVITVEATSQHHGLYHVLGGLISPLDGVAPSDLQIDSLVQRVSASEGGVKEVILALSPTMEGDTTAYYIYRRLQQFGIDVTIPARGLSVGNDLEYADELTLSRSIADRIPFISDTDNI